MNQQIATTPEQSKRIIACGVDPKSADFVWMEDEPNPRLTLRTKIIEDSNPYIVGYGWSLSALMDMINEERVLVAYLPKEKEWQVLAKINNVNHGCYSDSPIESCVKMIEVMYKYGYNLTR